jgi:hypothetical protein
VEAGQDNYIYVRTRNRGGVGAANVVATVYWAPVATARDAEPVDADQLRDDPERPDRESADGLGRDRLACRVIPASGHYCFVGLVGTAADPAPGLAAFSDWANFTTFTAPTTTSRGATSTW